MSFGFSLRLDGEQSSRSGSILQRQKPLKWLLILAVTYAEI
jgi:hypothetical protein